MGLWSKTAFKVTLQECSDWEETALKCTYLGYDLDFRRFFVLGP